MDLRPRRRTLAALVLGLALVVPAAVRAAAPGDEPRRVLTLLRGIGEEYREALDEEGRVVRPLEIDEAKLLLAEARDHATRLEPALAAELGEHLEALARALDARDPLESVETVVRAARDAVSAATGTTEEFLPPAAPSAARGATLYTTHCVSCHGEHGAGDGPDVKRLEISPADFTDPGFMRGETPADFFTIISVGRRKAAMPAWGDVLDVQARWDLIGHVFSLGGTAATLAEGRGIYLASCAGCHGVTGDGTGPLAAGLTSPPPDLSGPAALASRSDADLFAAVTRGMPGTAMPAFRRALGRDERWRVVAFVRALSLGAVNGARPAAVQAAAGAPAASSAAIAATRRLVDEAAAAHVRGDPRASDLATDAYMAFEPTEAGLRARDPDVVVRVEEAFLRFRGALRTPGNPIQPLVTDVHAALDAATTTLETQSDSWALFLQSATIMLREGFEVVLVLGALLAYVVKTGNAPMKRPIWAGAGAGVVGSVATAVLLMTVLRPARGAGEILEGVAMLLASVVLFWVSYWIVSKAEADRWQRYIRGKVDRAISTGSPFALGAAAFLAVYREGFETVLFYQALLGSAPAGDVMVPAGFVAGAAVLAVVYLVLARFGVRIPIRPFFLTTGTLLLVMATAFAGQGIHELQEGGVIAITPLAWMPSVPLLGLFPTVETAAAQGVLLALVVAGVFITLRGRRTEEAAGSAVRA